MNKRTGYVLSLNPESQRALFAKNVLEKIGFDVVFIKGIRNDNRVLSHKHSMQHIYNLIAESESEYSYVFEDDINVLEDITLDEIIEYEPISEMFFYLGICEWGQAGVNTCIKIRNRTVYSKQYWVRGCHAMGFSKKGAQAVLNFSKEFSDDLEPEYGGAIDMILEKFTCTHPANVCGYELESYIPGHKGVVYQDRNRFPSILYT